MSEVLRTAEKPRALVTGASEGIGRAFAKRLAHEGWQVTCVARNALRLHSLAEELVLINDADHRVVVADLSSQAGVQQVRDELFRYDYKLLVNNAGFGLYGRFYQQSLEKLDAMLAVNCSALMHLSHAFLKVAKEGAALINVSSGLAFAPYPVGAVYAATKSFVTSLSESLWLEHRHRGIYVMGLCPGVTESRFSERAGGMGSKKPPEIITESAESLVETAIFALNKRSRPTVISGWYNKVILAMLRLLTRRRIVLLMGKNP